MNRQTVTEWQALSALYEQADELAPAPLASFLSQLRAQQNPLLGQLERMLAARTRVQETDFLAEPPKLLAPVASAPGEWSEGLAVGPYTLVRSLGSGGMAEVWLARRHDKAFEREVAIKLPYRDMSRSQTRNFVQRFERERNILASLNHRNIARLLDAGVSESGQPWIALEYVEGQALPDWCDAQRLNTTARVRLFLQVLLAVQYAHANLVIHRDLKPANILVTAQGQVQLLDFGIAKILEPDGKHTTETELTQVAGRPLTLLYASPEQVRALPLTTASDVYSLGVVLYQVLCGETPYEMRRESAAQLEHAILEVEPRAPSRRRLSDTVAAQRASTTKALRKQLANDLDAIVLKAMHKQAEQRYSSVEAFRTDLQLWLDGKAVQAKPPSTLYYMRKFVARHRWGVALGAGAVLSLMAVTAVATILGIKARHESERASASRDFLIDMFRQADPNLTGGKEITAKQLLEQAKGTIQDKMKSQSLLQAELLRGLGMAQSNMSDYAQADLTLGEALKQFQSLGQTDLAAEVQIEKAEAAFAMGDRPRAQTLVESAVSAHQLQRLAPSTQVGYHQLVGLFEYGRANPQRAKAEFQRAYELAQKHLGDTDPKTTLELVLLARAESQMHDYAAAAQHLDAALALTQQQPKAEALHIVQMARADLEYTLGHYAAAEKLQNSAALSCERTLNPMGENCTNVRIQQAVILLLMGYHEKALTLLPYVTAQVQAAGSPRRQAEALVLACRLLLLNRKLNDQPQLWQRLDQLARADNSSKLPDYVKNTAIQVQAEALLTAGKAEAAFNLLNATLTPAATAHQADSVLSARMQVLQGVAAQHLGRYDVAQKLMRTGFEEYVRIRGAGNALSWLALAHQAPLLAAQGRAGEARALLDSALPPLAQSLGPEAPVYLRLQQIRTELQAASIPPSQSYVKAEFFL